MFPANLYFYYGFYFILFFQADITEVFLPTNIGMTYLSVIRKNHSITKLHSPTKRLDNRSVEKTSIFCSPLSARIPVNEQVINFFILYSADGFRQNIKFRICTKACFLRNVKTPNPLTNHS